MRVAVVGSRSWRDEERVFKVIRSLPPGAVVVSGGARGADRIAARCARSLQYAVVEHLADWDTYGRRAGMIRNQVLVDDCDALLAFWDGRSRGTLHSIRLAVAAGKPVEIFTADGGYVDLFV